MKIKKELVLVREGECLKCGKCCSLGYLAKTVAFKKAIKSNNIKKFISENDVDSVYCKYFDVKSNLCTLFNKLERPEVCINHPGSPNSTILGCGYKFRFKRVSKLELKKLEQEFNVKIFRRKKK